MVFRSKSRVNDHFLWISSRPIRTMSQPSIEVIQQSTNLSHGSMVHRIESTISYATVRNSWWQIHRLQCQTYNFIVKSWWLINTIQHSIMWNFQYGRINIQSFVLALNVGIRARVQFIESIMWKHDFFDRHRWSAINRCLHGHSGKRMRLSSCAYQHVSYKKSWWNRLNIECAHVTESLHSHVRDIKLCRVYSCVRICLLHLTRCADSWSINRLAIQLAFWPCIFQSNSNTFRHSTIELN